MSKAIMVAVIAATPGILGAVLGYLNSRAIRRQTATENAVPLGRLLEQLDRKVDRLTDSVVDLRERAARLEGQVAGPYLPLPTGEPEPQAAKAGRRRPVTKGGVRA
jgi:hypothetical protein